MKKKFLALACTCLLGISTITAAFADPTTTNITADGNSNCTVSATLPSSFTVTLPLSVTLEEKQDANGDTVNMKAVEFNVTSDLKASEYIKISYAPKHTLSDGTHQSTLYTYEVPLHLVSIDTLTNPTTETITKLQGFMNDIDSWTDTTETFVHNESQAASGGKYGLVFFNNGLPNAGDYSATVNFTIELGSGAFSRSNPVLSWN